MSWDGSYKAPEGQFRVVAEDTMPWPPEETLVGDFEDLEAARENKAEPYKVIMIFDDTGERLPNEAEEGDV